MPQIYATGTGIAPETKAETPFSEVI